ncbi:MAG: iron-sulfur cluster assembly scaffold protein [Notoacmeibacter sp.]
MDDIYNSKILEFAANISAIGRLDAPDATAKAHSKLCGSTVTADIVVKNGVISEFAQDVKACALGQAAASIVAKHVIGATPNEVRLAQTQMFKMLKEGGADPDGRFSDLKYLQPVRDYKARHASTLLTLDALVECLNQLERNQSFSEVA